MKAGLAAAVLFAAGCAGKHFPPEQLTVYDGAFTKQIFLRDGKVAGYATGYYRVDRSVSLGSDCIDVRVDTTGAGPAHTCVRNKQYSDTMIEARSYGITVTRRQ